MSEAPKMSDDAVSLHDTTDAAVWASEFCKRWPMGLCEVSDNEGVSDGDDWEGVMIGWFANAIMAGVDGESRKSKDRIEELEAKLARYNDLVADKIDLQSENIALKAKLAKAVVALQTIKMRAMPHKDDDDKDRKRQLIHIHSTSNTTLAELTGDTNG